MIKKGITAKKKCNKDVIPGTNYCEKHCKKEKNESINTSLFFNNYICLTRFVKK